MNRRSFLRAAFGMAVAPKYPDIRIAANWFISPPMLAVFIDVPRKYGMTEIWVEWRP